MQNQMPFNYQQEQQQYLPPAYNNQNQNQNQNQNINIQELVEINEIDESDNSEANQEKIPVSEIKSSINGLDNRVRKDNDAAAKPVAEKNDDAELADILDNVFDKNMAAVDEHKETYAEFGQYSDNHNVIKSIIPKDKTKAHFNKDTHPKELYKVIMLNNTENELPAEDIHSYSLETHKFIYEYNTANKQNVAKIATGFIYARCSTVNDVSIETQRKGCFNYTAEKGIKMLPFGFQYDNVSARNMNNLNHELGFWEHKIPDGSDVIIYSIDRLSRDLLKGIQFLNRLSTRGIKIHFVTNEIIYSANISSAAKSMVQQELQNAEKHSNMTSEKVKRTLKRLRDEGNVFGSAKYGYKHVKVNGVRTRVEDNQEQQNIRKIVSQYNNLKNKFGNLNIISIRKRQIIIMSHLVRWCNRSGLKYRNDKFYTLSQLKNIIKIGLTNNNNQDYNDVVVDGANDIDLDLEEAVGY